MAGDLLIDADIEAWLCDEIRTKLAAIPEWVTGGHVSNREHAVNDPGPAPAWQVIVRDDGIEDIELSAGECTLGISVLAGSPDNPAPAIRLAKIVKAVIKATPRVEPGNPVTDVSRFNGPYRVPEEASWTRMYMTTDLGVVASLI